jgi:GT2 family glycosyltransferase
MTTSIIILTWNRLELTQRTLKSVFANTTVPFRLIVVDNGSSDGSIEWLREMPQDHPLCQSYDFIFNDRNMGVAGGRNQGMKLSNEKYNDDWVAILDNDVEVPAGWLAEAQDIMSANSQLFIGVNAEGVKYPLIKRCGKEFQFKERGNAGGACLIIPKKLFGDIGYFTIEYRLYGEEDSDYSWRARCKGWEIGYIKDMAIHIGEGEADTGEYRKYKDECRVENIPQFRQNCGLYANGRKSCYIPFELPPEERK